MLTDREKAIAELAYYNGGSRLASDLIAMIQPALSVDPNWLREICERVRKRPVTHYRPPVNGDLSDPPDVRFGDQWHRDDGVVLTNAEADRVQADMREWRIARERYA